MSSEYEITQDRIDRLVDGELHVDDYRLLLEELDEVPDGWRRCAMAFLEAQAWESELRFVNQIGGDSPFEVPTREKRTVWSGWQVTTLAASVLVAFGLGMSSVFVSSLDTIPTTISGGEGSVPHENEALAAGSISSNQPVGSWPVNEQNAIDFSPAFRQQLREYNEFLAQMERDGHEVRRTQRQVPVRLEDGRRATVPVEQFEIVPVRNEFQ